MNIFKILVLIFLSYIVLACGGADERKAAYLEKAEKSFNAGDLDKARIELQNVLQIDPKDARAYFKLGNIFEQKKDYNKAFGNYSRAAELNPDNNEYQAKIGRFYLILAGDIDKAREKAELVLSKDKNDKNGLLLNAGILLKQDKLDEAKKIAVALFDSHPDDVEIASFLATVYAKENEYAKIIEVFDKAISLNPDSLTLQTALANTLYFTKDYDRAEKILKKILAAHPDVFQNHLTLARFYQKIEKPEEAEAVLRAAISADEADVQRKLVWIEYIQQTKGNEPAFKELETIVNNNLKVSQLRLALAGLQIEMNNIDGAIATYKTAAKDFSDEETGVIARVSLAKLYMQKKDVETATSYINEAIEISPNDSEVNLVKGKIAIYNKNMEQAIISLRTVIKNSPDNIEAYLLLAASHKVNNEAGQAKDVLGRAYENNRGNAKVLLPLAKYYVQSNNAIDAEKVIDDYLRLDANNYDALSIKASILNGNKSFSQAYELASKLIKLYPDKENGYIQSLPELLTNKKANDAVKLLDEGYLKSNDITLLKMKADVLIADGKMSDAIASLKLVDKKNIDESIHLLLVKAYMAKKDNESAKQEMLASIKEDKTRRQSYITLAGVYYDEKNIKQTISILKEGINSHPDDIKLAMSLAAYYEKTGDAANAMKVYENILSIKSDNLIATNNLAALLADDKSNPDSIIRAKELADKIKNVSQPAIKDTVGWVYYRAGNYSDAVEILKQVVTSMPDIQIFNYHLGMAYYKSGDKVNAKNYLQKSVANGGNFTGIDDARATLGLL